MKLQWILLALFLMAMVNNIAKAMCNPMLKNVLRLISIPVAFIITFILQVTGVFRAGIDKLIELIPINEWLPEYAGIINEGVDFLTPFLCTLLGAFVFTLAFGIILFLLNTIHTNLIYKFIVRRQRKKEIKEFRLSLKEENERVRESIRESEERIWNAVDEAVDENPDHPVYKYEPLDDDEIERMVEEKIKKDKKRKKKMNFFKESGEHKAISIVCGVVSGFLLFGISWMGFFYTMDVLSDATSGIHDTDAVNTKIYKFAEMLDEHVVAEYEECFVYELYDGMAMIDLTNYTIRAGGKIEVADGSVSYADDIMRKYMKHAVRLACEVTDATSNQEHIGEDVEVLLKDPTMVSLLAKGVIVFVEYFESQNPDLFDSWENPPVTDGEVDLIAVLMGDIIRAYKNDDGSWSAESVENDFNAIVDVVVIAAENKLLANIIANSVVPPVHPPLICG